jgi:hypothetical protein
MFAFIPIIVPVFVRFIPLLVGAGAGALAVLAVNGSGRKDEKIRELKERLDRLEQRNPK